MLTWMLYVMAVSLVLGIAAMAAEHQARLRRRPTRWFWLMAILASLLIPTVIASVSIQLPPIFGEVVSGKVIALRETTSVALSPITWVPMQIVNTRVLRDIDGLLKTAWLSVSLMMLCALLASGVHLHLRKRRWRRDTFFGTPVYIAADVGPAVVGLFQPRIVIPSWLLSAPEQQQSAVLAHESAHIDADDPMLLTIALTLLVFMPWNLPLWWQLSRLRRAIEVDCDARVLRAGHEVASYGKALLEVGERQSGYVGAVAAMSESKSFLEKRIAIMLSKPKKWWRISAVALACVSVGLVAIAAQVSPPNATEVNGERSSISLSERVLENYVGTYKLNENSVLAVTRKGQQLAAQLTGQPSADIYPSSATEFFYKIVKATIEFVPDDQGRAMSLVLRQNGNTISAPRIDSATAEQIKVNVMSKVQSQSATPGSEAALRRLIAGELSGNPNYSEMSPLLAEAVRKQLPRIKPMLDQLGSVQSVEFKGVGNQGWDIYDVKHEHGAVQYRIMLNSSGIIEGALMMAAP